MTNGFVPLRRGILAHIRNGSLPHGEALAYMVIIASADPSTGIWYGSAKALAGEFNFPEREARRLLEALERKGYLRRFPKPGAHSNYPVLANKSEITVGARRGTRLCADKSTSLENLVYENGEEAGEQKGEHTREETCEHTAPIRELKRKREKNNGAALAFGEGVVSSDGKPTEETYRRIGKKVYDHHIHVMGRKPAMYKFTEKRRSMLKARAREAVDIALKTNPAMEIAEAEDLAAKVMCQCIDALRGDRWYRGENERGREYQDLEHVFRSTEKFEQWLNKRVPS